MKKYYLLAVLFYLPFWLSFSQEQTKALPFSFYTGLYTGYFTLGSAFDGQSYFYTDEAVIYVPKIEPGLAYGIQFGLRFKSGSWDMGYQFSLNRYSHSDYTPGTLRFHNIKLLGLTFYLNNSEKLRPYIVTDASMAWFNIEDGATGRDSYTGQTGKSYFSGVVLGLGAGIEWKIYKKLSFRLEAMPEWFKLSNVKGITKEYWDVKKFSCLKLNASAGLYIDL